MCVPECLRLRVYTVGYNYLVCIQYPVCTVVQTVSMTGEIFSMYNCVVGMIYHRYRMYRKVQ